MSAIDATTSADLLEPVAFREIAFDSEPYEQSLLLREQVLRLPLGLRLDSAVRSLDPASRHFIATRRGTVVATALASPLASHHAQIRQVAVHSGAQRHGIGRALMIFTETALAASGITLITLEARAPVLFFYQTLGYETHGEPFLKLGIPHHPCRKHLP